MRVKDVPELASEKRALAATAPVRAAYDSSKRIRVHRPPSRSTAAAAGKWSTILPLCLPGQIGVAAPERHLQDATAVLGQRPYSTFLKNNVRSLCAYFDKAGWQQESHSRPDDRRHGKWVDLVHVAPLQLDIEALLDAQVYRSLTLKSHPEDGGQ